MIAIRGTLYQTFFVANMPEKYDQAYEELKREDFLNKIKSLVPLILFGVFMILLVTGLYTWHDARSEKQLYMKSPGYKKLGFAILFLEQIVESLIDQN